MIIEELRDGMATVTFDAPATRNALGAEDMARLTEQLDVWADDPSVRALVIRANGPAFCAGADFGLLGDLAADGADRAALLRPGVALARRIITFPTPTVAAVQGAAYGGGASIALGCDVVVATRDARFGFVFTRIGLPGGDMLTTWLLSRRVGTRRAFRLLADGELVDAADAVDQRIVDELVDDAAGARARAAEIAAAWAQGPANALAATKAALLRLETGGVGLEQQAEFELGEMVRATAGEEFQVALTAWMERADPDLRVVPRELRDDR